MKVRVDQDTCLGDGACISICPEIFEMDGDVVRTIMVEVPEEIKDSCNEAAAACPVEAIIIDE